MNVNNLTRNNNRDIVTTDGTNNEKGSGLGLSLIKEQLQKMNGGFYIESKLGEGTSVNFYFPS